MILICLGSFRDVQCLYPSRNPRLQKTRLFLGPENAKTMMKHLVLSVDRSFLSEKQSSIFLSSQEDHTSPYSLVDFLLIVLPGSFPAFRTGTKLLPIS